MDVSPYSAFLRPRVFASRRRVASGAVAHSGCVHPCYVTRLADFASLPIFCDSLIMGSARMVATEFLALYH